MKRSGNLRSILKVLKWLRTMCINSHIHNYILKFLCKFKAYLLKKVRHDRIFVEHVAEIKFFWNKRITFPGKIKKIKFTVGKAAVYWLHWLSKGCCDSSPVNEYFFLFRGALGNRRLFATIHLQFIKRELQLVFFKKNAYLSLLHK